MDRSNEDILDCLIVGGGPAGLTAAVYLGRFGRRFLVVDAGEPRAAWIPVSHNIPFFGEGIPGPEILARQRDHAGRYGTRVLSGAVTDLKKAPRGPFVATVREEGGGERRIELCQLVARVAHQRRSQRLQAREQVVQFAQRLGSVRHRCHS